MFWLFFVAVAAIYVIEVTRHPCIYRALNDFTRPQGCD